ncbi:MAG: CBS domain-containing protein [Caldilineaceae bacterium]|nr:CBS domain-containing protein [Caldilineaceae bacterium]
MHRVPINQIMQRSVVTILPTALAVDAAQRMEEFAIRRLPVVDENGWLVGIVTDTDVLEAETANRVLNAYEPGAEEQWLAVSDIMTRDVITIDASATLGELALRLMTHKVGGLPVVEAASLGDGSPRLIGIVTETDIFRLLAEAWLGEQGQGQPR